MSAKKNQPNIVAESNRSRSYIPKKDEGFNAAEKSYVHVVKGNPHSGSMGSDPKPAIALDDDCLLTKDLRNSLLGRVKEFASLSNLRTALINKGFVNFKIYYMGELWVLLEFDSVNSKNLFQDNIGVRSWFSQLKDASLDFNTDGRIIWVEIEGVRGGRASVRGTVAVRGVSTRQYEVLFRRRLDQSEGDTWHRRVSVRGTVASVRGRRVQ
ncbi:hypothetical protein Tco_1290648 [Tanacetum coccineum]